MVCIMLPKTFGIWKSYFEFKLVYVELHKLTSHVDNNILLIY